MQRDLDLTRRIMLAIEADDALIFEGTDPATVGYHLNLILGAGFLINEEVRFYENGAPDTRPGMYQLSWEGCEYLLTIKDDGVWSKVKSAIGVVGGSVSVALVKEIGTALAKESLKSHGIHF